MQIEIMAKTKETEQEGRARRLKRYREELDKGMEKAKAGAKGGGEHGRRCPHEWDGCFEMMRVWDLWEIIRSLRTQACVL